MMRATVRADETSRTVVLDVAAGSADWDLEDEDATWRTTRRIFRPDTVELVLKNVSSRWAIESVKAAGQLVLKDGTVSSKTHARDSCTWYGLEVGRTMYMSITQAPAWIRDIADEVRSGAYALTWTSSGDTPKVVHR